MQLARGYTLASSNQLSGKPTGTWRAYLRAFACCLYGVMLFTGWRCSDFGERFIPVYRNEERQTAVFLAGFWVGK